MLTHLQAVPVKPRRVVVLGAAGFVGDAVCRLMRARGDNVVALGRQEVDLLSAEAAGALGTILHAQDSLVIVAAKAPAKTDADVVDNLRMEAAIDAALARVPVTHVVYVSSDAVYADSDGPLRENSSAQPASLHGVMHLAREVMLANAFGGALCILRPTLIYGNRDPHNGYGPNRFRRLAERGQEIVLFGEGEERRDHVLIDDVAEIIVNVLDRRSVGTLNVATGVVTSFRAIAEMIAGQYTPRPTIRGTPRTGPMPHNGYRAFGIEACSTAFPDFRYATLAEGVGRMRGAHPQ
ncbi:MAG: NAD-dependent epimerase/dehydratase family protein [Pseudorhodoplanes sp.]